MAFDAKGYMASWQGFREMNTRAWAAREAVNNYCCGAGPHTAGEVRVMPCGGDSNLILCRSCWYAELAYRIDRHKEQAGTGLKTALPAWETAKVYDAGE